MKNVIIALSLIFSASTSFGQTEPVAKTAVELQTQELVDFYHLDKEKAAVVLKANTICASKIAALTADTQMKKEVIEEGIQYNKDLRLATIFNLLTVEQKDLYKEFQYRSKYNVTK